MSDIFLRMNILLSKKQWSRSKLAQKTGIKISTIHGLWQKKRIPRGDDLVTIAKALGTTAEYLITGEGKEINDEREGISDREEKVFHEIVEFLANFTDEELIEVKGVIRGYSLNFFRSSFASIKR